MSQAYAREYFTQGGNDVANSPYVLKNMGRYENISIVATSVTKVEGSIDGVSFFDITAAGTTFTGGILFKSVCFNQYRITYTGTMFVNAN